MDLNIETHHGEPITPAPQPQQSESGSESMTVKGSRSACVDGPVPLLTLQSAIMGLFISIGGMLFSYDTGQISGFQEMNSYLQRYGEYSSGKYGFSHVRSGLIVGLLSIGALVDALVSAPIAHRLGRKWSITLWNIIFISGITGQVT